jgi:Flp pilus assembly protein TadD
MDLKRLPFLPLHFFYFQFSRIHRRLFLLGMLALLLAGGYAFFSIQNPTYWSLELQEISEVVKEEVVVSQVENRYRVFDLPFEAFRQTASFNAGPLLPHATPTYLYWLLQLLGWTFLLTAASQIRSRWAYLFYFVFVLFAHFSGLGRLLIPGWEEGGLGYLADLLVVAPFLLLAYLFQVNTLRWSVGLRFGIFLLLLLLAIGGVWLQHDWVGLHALSSDGYLLQVILGLLFFFFISKEPTNLFMALANNRRDPRNRLAWGWILAVYLLWVIAALVMMNAFLGLAFLPEGFSWGLRPLHILILAALIVPFTAQNHFHFVRTQFTSNAVYTFLLLGGSLLTLSQLGYLSSQGDFTFIDSWDRLAGIFLFFIGLGHSIYIFVNHFDLLKKKTNLYFLLTSGPVVRFVMVWIVGLVGLVLMEGRTGWSAFPRIIHSVATQAGDQQQLRLQQQGNASDLNVLQRRAELRNSAYRVATKRVVNSIKAHYNLGIFLFDKLEKADEALAYLQKVHRFPYASINAANLLQIKGENEAAFQLLQSKAEGSTNPYLLNNLGILYLRTGQPDSAIATLQKALLVDPQLSAAYANLAELYLRYDKPEAARDFLEASLDTRKPSATALTNALAYQLTQAADFEVEEKRLPQHPEFSVRFNYLLTLIQRGEFDQARPLARELDQVGLTADAMVLDAYLLFRQDSIEYAVSRFDYVDQLYPGQQARAYYLLGLAYYERGIPEMARVYFEKAGTLGMPEGALYGALMDLDTRRLDTAYAKLSDLRVAYDGLWEPASKELAMLQLTVNYDNPVFAMTDWDISKLGFADRMRIGLYADSLGSYIPALENFRQAIQLDSTSYAPYLEMARIYNRYADSFAIENLKYGLEVAPEAPALKLELAWAYVQNGRADSARQVLEGLSEAPAWVQERGRVEAKLALLEGDTARAQQLLEELVEKDILATASILDLASLYRQLGNSDAGSLLISKALKQNSENPGLWYYYAVFSKAWGQEEDAGYGALRAIQLSSSADRKQVIQDEFESEIKLIVTP